MLKAEIPSVSYVYADKSRAELHVLGAVSGDPKFIQALESSDYHRFVISLAKRIAMEEVTPPQRESSKRISFSLAYTAFTPEVAAAYAAQDLGISSAEALETVLEIMGMFPDLVQWATDEIYEWFDNEGWYTYLCNARKHEPLPLHIPREINKLKPTHSARVVINQVAQNSIGLLLKMVLAKMADNPILQPKVSNLIQVFDAVGFTCPTEDLPQVVAELSALMTTVLTVECERTGRTTTTIIRSDIATSTKGFGHVQKISKDALPQFTLDGIQSVIDTLTDDMRSAGTTSSYSDLRSFGIPAQWVYWKRTARPNPYVTGARPIDLVDNPANPFANPLMSEDDGPIFGY